MIHHPVHKQEFFSYLSKDCQDALAAFAAQNFHAEEGEIQSLWFKDGTPRRIVLFGLGDNKKWNERKYPLIARRLVQYAKKERIKDFAVCLPSDFLTDIKDIFKQFAVNAHMAAFDFDIYKEKQKTSRAVESIFLGHSAHAHSALDKAIAEGMIIGEEVNE